MHSDGPPKITMNPASITAFVTSGRGIASSARVSEIEELSELKRSQLIHGSLNLISTRPVWLNPETAIFTNGDQFYWDACLNDFPVIVNRWSGCPVHVYEVFATECLRDKWNLADGDPVSLSFPIKAICSAKTASVAHNFIWRAVWRWREKQYYADGAYSRLMCHGPLRHCTHRSRQ